MIHVLVIHRQQYERNHAMKASMQAPGTHLHHVVSSDPYFNDRVTGLNFAAVLGLDNCLDWNQIQFVKSRVR